MKKILVAILLMVYFTVSTGFIVCTHFCMDRFASVELGSGSDSKCTKCGMHKKDNGCCRDELKVIKLQQTHTAPQFFSADFSLFAPLPALIPHVRTPLINSADFEHHQDHGPPLSGVDICILHSVFRI